MGSTTTWADAAADDLDPPPDPPEIASPVAFAEAYSRGTYKRYPHVEIFDEAITETIETGGRLILSASVRHSKALDIDTVIPTPDGWTPIGQLRQGDVVFDERGRLCTVTQAHDAYWSDDVHEVVFSDGSTIVADGPHRWITYSYREHQALGQWRRANGIPHRAWPDNWTAGDPTSPARSAKVRTTTDMAADRGRFYIPAAGPLDLPDRSLPIDPYVLGVWLGDGTAAFAAVTSADPFVLDEIERRGYEVRHSPGYGPYGHAVMSLYKPLRLAGLLRNKHVPAEYLRASARQRLDLLRGLMDSDGHFAKAARNQGRTEFVNQNEWLADAVYELFTSLGAKATKGSHAAKFNGVATGATAFRVGASPPFCPFLLPRKADRWSDDSKGSLTRRTRAVSEVRPAPSRWVRCISVDSPSRLYLAGETMVPTHNSETVSKWTPAWFIGKNPDKRVILAGHEADFAARWGRAARDILTEYGPEVFGVSVSRRSEAANRWDLDRRAGGMLTVGVGGSPIGRGADLCVAAGTLVETPQGVVDIATLAHRGGTLWGYDHESGEAVAARINGATESSSPDLCEIEFASGRRLRCTPDHPVYVDGRGYVEAGTLTPGARVKATGRAPVRPVRGDVHPDVEGSTESREARQVHVLHEAVRSPAQRAQAPAGAPQTSRDGDARLRSVLRPVRASGLRAREEDQAGQNGLLLLDRMRSQAVSADAPLRTLRRTDREEGTPLLPGLHRLPQERDQTEARRHHLPRVRNDVPAEVVAPRLLLPGVREPGARHTDGRGRQLPLQGRDQLRALVPVDAPADPRTGRRLRRVWRHRPRHGDGTTPSGAPHQRGPGGQPPGEPHHLVPPASCGAPQVETDTVAVVRHLREGGYTVYDLQVEGTHNFFAGKVLVHNCIVDDPFKSYEDAMSPLQQKKVQEWWSGTMASRIEPDAAVIIVLARWHENDLAGWLMREDTEHWRELRMPAICDDPENDPMGRELGEPLWPERWPLEALNQRRREVSLAFGESVWLAQFQQTPSTPTGGVFPEHMWRFIGPDEVPDGLSWVRGWDLAASKDAGDWTVGARMAQLPDGRFVIADVVRGQWEGSDVRARLLAAAAADPEGTRIELPQDPGQAGKDQAAQLTTLLAGYAVHSEPQTGSKQVRATGYAAQQQAGNVLLVRGDWNEKWMIEHTSFPRASHDDQVDAAATAFNKLVGTGGPATSTSPADMRIPRSGRRRR